MRRLMVFNNAIVTVLLLFALPPVVFASVHRIPIKRTKVPIQNITSHYGNEDDTLLTAPPIMGVREHVNTRRHVEMFLGSIQLGQPNEGLNCWFCVPQAPKTFQVHFDTSSANLWVFHVRAKKMIERNKWIPLHPESAKFHHTYYDRGESSTFEAYNADKPRVFEATLVEGAVYTGFMGKEHLEIGDTVVKGVDFAQVDSMNKVALALGNGYDGVLGLGLPNLAKNKARPAFLQMYDEGHFEEPIFSFYFSANGDDGVVVLGGVDESLYSGDLKYVGVLDLLKLGDKFWQVKMDHVSVGSRIMTPAITPANLDTGGAFISAPISSMEKIVAYLRPQGAVWNAGHDEVSIDCEKRMLLEDLRIVINGETYSFTPLEYFPDERKDGSCVLFITPHGDGAPLWLLGRPFLQKYYTVYDHGVWEGENQRRPRIGFALAKHASPTNKKKGGKKKAGRKQTNKQPDYHADGEESP